MEVILFIKSLLGLIVILAILLFMFFSSLNEKKKKKKMEAQKRVQQSVPVKKNSNLELRYFQSIIKDKDSSTKALKEALEAIIENYGVIPPKIGLRAHPDFTIYRDVLFTLCRHPHTNKDLIIYFDKNLSELNPEYKSYINDTLTMGLDSRGY